VKIDWVQKEIARMRGQIREIRILQRAGASTVSVEALLARMRAKADGLCQERADLRRLSKASVVSGNDPKERLPPSKPPGYRCSDRLALRRGRTDETGLCATGGRRKDFRLRFS
jgi:hypothetical protein